MKKVIQLVLCVAILLCSFGCSKVWTLSEQDAAVFKSYEIDVNKLPTYDNGQPMPVKDFILSISEYVETVNQELEYPSEVYSSDTLQNYLNDCKELRDLSLRGKCLYVSYNTNHGREVSLCYIDDELFNKVIYDTTTDIIIIDNGTYTQIERDFRNSSG